MTRRRIGVVGPGAIGGTVAAWLAQEHDVIVGARRGFQRLEVETPYGAIEAVPLVLTEPETATPVDWVLVATKAYDVEPAARWFPYLLRADTPLAVLQNGVEHVERFSRYLPAARILPVMVDCSAEREAPGKIAQRSHGRMLVPAGELGRDFVQLFSQTKLDVATHDDFLSVSWKKLCLNSAGAVSAVLGAPTQVARHEGIAEIVKGVVRECVRVGRAEGARLDDGLVDSVLARQRSCPPEAFNSLTLDRRSGRPMEIELRNGVIVRLGQKHGIPTPLNAMLVAMLEAVSGQSESP